MRKKTNAQQSVTTMLTFQNITLIIAATTTALMAGLFFAWSFSITLGLARLSDEAYIAAMQAGNRATLKWIYGFANTQRTSN